MKKQLTIFSSLFLGFFLPLSCHGPSSSKESEKEKVTAGPKKVGLPAWEETVFYQIFPDRFHNGDPGNDPTYADTRGGWPDRYLSETENAKIAAIWQAHPWTSDWYELQPWEKGVRWEKWFDWARPTDPVVKYHASMRRYGGDLQGIMDKLDYLQALAVNAIYLNPIFESPSLHKYDARMYHHVDNNFGPSPVEDAKMWEKEDPANPATWQWTTADKLFLELIRQCHERNIRVILDGVFNHTGTEFWAFKDLVEKQEASAYKDWYDVVQFDDPATPENEFDYKGWIGIKDLPEFVEDENGLVTGPRAHVKAIAQRWMDPNGDGDPSDGIDGWRLDVAEMVDIAFWKEFNGWVKDINPDAYITGEIWWHHWDKGEMFNAAPWLADGVFDAVMNYRFARAVKQFVADGNKQIKAQDFVDSLQAIYHDYPFERVLTCQNLVDSHDLDRMISQIQNPDRIIDHQSDPYGNPNYDFTKPDAEAYQKLKLVAALQATLPGIPMYYYGTEAGMWGGDDPDQRKPMVWPDSTYADEQHDIYGKKRDKIDPVNFDQSLFDWYKKMISIRRENVPLQKGKIKFHIVNNLEKTIAFKRTYKGEEILIVLNNSSATVIENLSDDVMEFAEKEVKDLVSGFVFDKQEFSVELEPYGVVVLKGI